MSRRYPYYDAQYPRAFGSQATESLVRESRRHRDVMEGIDRLVERLDQIIALMEADRD